MEEELKEVEEETCSEEEEELLKEADDEYFRTCKVETLADTACMMSSEDFKIRLKAEYYQTKIRLKGLNEFIQKLKDDELDFTPKSDLRILKKQVAAMRNYLDCLSIRIVMEGVTL